MDIPKLQQEFTHVLEAMGAEGALKFLNARLPHRYTAIYRLDGGVLKNLYLHDKQGEVRPEFLAEVPLTTSFCQFVLRDGFFSTESSAGDHRLNGHPYQGVMASYTGVPLTDSQGAIVGTICHFDVIDRPMPDDEFILLQDCAKRLPAYVPGLA